MKCENCFCVYLKENTCTLNEISIGISGLCENRKLINFEEYYQKKKQKAKKRTYKKRVIQK